MPTEPGRRTDLVDLGEGASGQAAKLRLQNPKMILAFTAVCSMASVLVAGVAGILIARALGPGSRGIYAAALAWYGILIVLGDVGQSAATTFHVSGSPAKASNFVAAAGRITAWSAAVIGAAAAAWSLLTWGQAEATAVVLTALSCIATLLGVGQVAALQAIDIRLWNSVRLLQPLLYLGCILALQLADALTVTSALAAMLATLVLKLAVSLNLCRWNQVRGLDQGPERSVTGLMFSFGWRQFLASAPTAVTARIDQVLLSVLVTPAELGNYAVAASLTTLGAPFVAAIGNVAFPKLAARNLTPHAARQLQWRSFWGSAFLAGMLMAALSLSAPWIMEHVFGADYSDAVLLTWLLAPGGVFVAVNQVCADLISAQGQPGLVARAQTIACATTFVLLAVLVPLAGVKGAAVASSLTTGIATALLAVSLKRGTSGHDRDRQVATAAR